MEEMRSMILFVIINALAISCYLLGKEIQKGRRERMKRNKYLKARLSMANEDECLHNTFALYVAGISELLLIVILQGELNLISIPCISSAAIALCSCSYQIGRNSIQRSEDDIDGNR